MSDKKSLIGRRAARWSAIALTAASIGFSQTALAQSAASELESEFFLELLLDVDPQIDAGNTSIAPVTGGTFRVKSRVVCKSVEEAPRCIG